MDWGSFETIVVTTHSILLVLIVRVLGGEMEKPGDVSIVNTVPPGWVFSVVWPILFTCIGFAWAYAGTDTGAICIYTLLDLSLIAWAPLYNKYSKRLSMYMLHVSLMFCFYAYAYGPVESKYFISPLIAWLLLASKLNYTVALNVKDEQKTETNQVKSVETEFQF